MKYRFILEPYKGLSTRHICPQCGYNKSFSRYVDLMNEIQFPSYVGRCDRENSCSYHFKAKDYFLQSSELMNINKIPVPGKVTTKQIEALQPSYIDLQLANQSFTNYSNNNLFQFLASKFGHSKTMLLMEQYLTGTHSKWPGACVFWQIDFNMNIRSGKVLLYNLKNGRRIKQPYNHISWVHTLCKFENFNLKQCFFGEHLLAKDSIRPVAIVESEKTALICSSTFPQFIWLSTGGKNGSFQKDSLEVLRNRKVILVPDLGATEYWNKKSEMMKELGIQVVVFDYLEKLATTKQREEGFDIADFILDTLPIKLDENHSGNQKNSFELISVALDLIYETQIKKENAIN